MMDTAMHMYMYADDDVSADLAGSSKCLDQSIESGIGDGVHENDNWS